MAAVSYGVWWALASAMFSAMYMIPWKLSVSRGPVGISVLSMIVSAALANGLLSLRKSKRRDASQAILWGPRKQWQLAAGLAGLTLVGNTLSGVGASSVSAPVLSVVLRTEVLWIAVLSLAWLSERVTGRFWLGAGFAAAGLVVLQGGFGADGNRIDGPGVVYGVGAALVFSVMVVVTRRFIRQIEPVQLNGKRLWLAAGLCVLWQGAGIVPSELNVAQVGYGALAGLFGPVGARLCLMFAVRHVQASTAAICVQLAPLFTTLFAAALFDEVPGSNQFYGGGLMLFGVVLSLVPIQRFLAWARGRG